MCQLLFMSIIDIVYSILILFIDNATIHTSDVVVLYFWYSDVMTSIQCDHYIIVCRVCVLAQRMWRILQALASKAYYWRIIQYLLFVLALINIQCVALNIVMCEQKEAGQLHTPDDFLSWLVGIQMIY